MSYVAELENTARALTRLAINGNRGLTVAELDIVLSARRALINVLSTVHHDVTGLEAGERPRLSFEKVTRDPVGALTRALDQYPVPPPASSPSEAFTVEPESAAGRTWQDVGRHATLAQHHWTTGHPMHIDETGTWTAVADVAAMASLLSDVDIDLLRTMRTWDARRLELRALEEGPSIGLGFTAREALRLAAAGPLNETSPDRERSAPPPAVVLVAGPEELISAVRQISVLLRDSGHVSPEHVRLIAIANIRTCGKVAEAFDRGSMAQRVAGARIREHAARLTEAVERPWPMTSMGRGDGRAFHQAHDIQRAIRRWLPDELAANLDPAELLPALGDATRELSATADRQMSRGQWLVPISVQAPRRARVMERWLGYEPYRPGSPPPRQVTRLAAAADHALALLAAGFPERSASTSNPAPVVTVNTGDGPAPTADPAAPRPPPSVRGAVRPTTMPLRQVAAQRQTVRPRAPWTPPATPRRKRR